MSDGKAGRDGVWVAGLLLAAAGLRCLLLIHPAMDSDTATIGLMAMHFLSGEFTPISWGVHYGGTLEPLLAAGLLAILGPTPQALSLAPVLASLVYVYLVHLIARRLWGRAAGLAALALAALGPYYLIWFSASARGLHAELLALGALLIWLTLRLLESDPRQAAYRWLALAFGLAAGVGFWTNLLMAGVIAPALLALWRRHGRLPLSLAGMLMLAGFLAGSFPLWWHNLIQGWGTLDYSTKTRTHSGLLANLTVFLRRSLPVLLGALVDRTYAWVLPGLGQAMLLLGGGALLASLGVWARDCWSYARGKAEAAPGALLLLTALAVGAVFCLLGGGDMGSHRYLLALYLVLPLALARTWNALWARGRALKAVAGLGLALLLAGNLAGVYLTTSLGDPEQRRLQQWEADLARQVIAHFHQETTTHVYCPDYWQAPLWTFLAREQVVFVQPFGDRHPEYLDELLRAEGVGLAVSEAEAHLWRRSLTLLGAAWQEKLLAGSLVAFTQIRPPQTRPRPLPRDGWQAQADPQPQLAAQAWDMNATTRWSTGQPQRPGQWYSLDLEREVEGVCQVLLFYGSPEDRPRTLRLQGSADGQTWQDILRVKERAAPAWWSGEKPVFTPESPWEELRFVPRRLRHLRLSQEGEHANSYWSLCEMLVGAEPPEPPAAPPQWAAAAAWLAHELPGQKQVWGEPALAAWLSPRLRAQPRPRPRPAWLREYLSPELLPAQDRPLYLALDASRQAWAEESLRGAGWRSRARVRHGVALLEAIPPRHSEAKPAAPEYPATAHQDGAWLLEGRPAPLAGLLLDSSRPPYLSPAELELTPAAAETPPVPLEYRHVWPGQLYWSGWLPLAARPGPLRLDLPRPATGDLRLRKAPWAAGDLPLDLRPSPLPQTGGGD